MLIFHPLILNAIFYVLRSGCAWRMLPHDFPAWQTVYGYFWRWRRAGLWERMNDALRKAVRLQAGREAEPSAAIIDSQSVKTTETKGQRGYDSHKKVTGRKRHILVDVLGLILVVLVHQARGRSSKHVTRSQKRCASERPDRPGKNAKNDGGAKRREKVAQGTRGWLSHLNLVRTFPLHQPHHCICPATLCQLYLKPKAMRFSHQEVIPDPYPSRAFDTI